MIEVSTSGAAAQIGVAGDTLNTAIYLKRSAPDVQVDYITRLGDDPFSIQVRDFIAGESIGTSQIDMMPNRSPGLYAITTDDTGERTFTYWRDRAPARELFADGDFSRLDGYDVIYLSGISIAILPKDVRDQLLAYLQNSPAKLAFDSNYRPRLWENAETARATTQNYWAAADIAMPSIDDEMALFGQTGEQVETLFTTAGRQGALKRGPLGPLSLGEAVEQSYPNAAAVIDTTAAGDSFNGGYLGALLQGQSQRDALMAGHTLASQVIGQRGAIIPNNKGTS